MNWGYIARQRDRYNEYSEQWRKLDCLHRIASHANLFDLHVLHQIDQIGWTTEQQNLVKRWLSANEEAIAQAKAEDEALFAQAEMQQVV